MSQINPEAKRQIKAYFRSLRLIFIAIVGSVFMFAFAIWLVSGYDAEAINPELDKVLKFATPISTVALILLSFALYAGRLKPARERKTMYEKMEGFRTAWLFRSITLDLAGFVNVISYILTTNEMYYYIFGVVLLLFIFNYPTADKFITELQLSPVESQVIRDHLTA